MYRGFYTLLISKEKNVLPPIEEVREEISYEEKMDMIAEQLEELILDALVVALDKMRRRNEHYDRLLYRSRIIV
tara:strand:+ start:338 stop:559 length:222 start_codon:yes stop_codon:yes gene_type:complete